MNEQLPKHPDPQEVDSLVQKPTRMEGVTGNCWRDHSHCFKMLDPDDQFRTIYESSVFRRRVSVGLHYRSAMEWTMFLEISQYHAESVHYRALTEIPRSSSGNIFDYVFARRLLHDDDIWVPDRTNVCVCQIVRDEVGHLFVWNTVLHFLLCKSIQRCPDVICVVFVKMHSLDCCRTSWTRWWLKCDSYQMGCVVFGRRWWRHHGSSMSFRMLCQKSSLVWDFCRLEEDLWTKLRPVRYIFITCVPFLSSSWPLTTHIIDHNVFWKTFTSQKKTVRLRA